MLLADLLAVIFQPYCPPLGKFSGAVVLMFPVMLAYGALALPFAGALALAFCNGLLWDALTVQFLTPGMYLRDAPVEEFPLGWSIILFGVLAMLVHGLRPRLLGGGGALALWERGPLGGAAYAAGEAAGVGDWARESEAVANNTAAVSKRVV